MARKLRRGTSPVFALAQQPTTLSNDTMDDNSTATTRGDGRYNNVNSSSIIITPRPEQQLQHQGEGGGGGGGGGREDLRAVGDRQKRWQRKWDIAKVSLRSVCVLLVAVDAAELIAAQTSWRGGYFEGAGYPILVALGLWDLIEFVVIIARRGISNGVRPEAHVGMELFLCLGTGGTVVGLAYPTQWGDIHWVPVEPWAIVILTQLGFLVALFFFRFCFFVRACVEVERKRKNRLAQKKLALEIEHALQIKEQEGQGMGGYDSTYNVIPPSSPRTAEPWSSSHRNDGSVNGTSIHSSSAPPRPRSAPEERDFRYKYNFPIATVPELLGAGVHPEDARNQKVLIGTFPR